MLKIKDNIDLKELEKFGFDSKQTKEKDDLIYGFDSNLLFYKETGIIRLPWNSQETAMNTLYDLIKADLVEKVSDKEC